MRRRLFITAIMGMFALNGALSAHCQMPCGIYHDDMVFEMFDQYLETMYKAVTELEHISLDGKLADKNQFIRWIMLKEQESDAAADLMTKYFLQQKIKPDEDDTAKKIISAHKLLFLMVRIKQNIDSECVKSFANEWEQFKLMFHIKGYQCEMEKRKLSEWDRARFINELDDKVKKDKAVQPEAK